MHESVGDFNEAAFADSIDQHLSALAHHYGESRNTERKRLYFRKAGDAARAAYANETAIVLFRRLLEVVPAEESGGGAADDRGDRLLVGDWQDAERAFRDSVERAGSVGAADEEALSRCALGSPLKGELLLRGAWPARIRRGRSSPHTATGHGRFGRSSTSPTPPGSNPTTGASLVYSEEHLRLAELAGNAVAASMAVEQMGLVHWHVGEYDRARACFERALEAAREATYVRGAIHACNDLAGLHHELGDYPLALARVEEGLEAAREIGYRPAVAWMTGNAGGELYRHAGDLRQALACYAYGFETTAALRDWIFVLINAGNIALALAAQDRLAEAQVLLRHAVAISRAIESPYQPVRLGCTTRPTCCAGWAGRARRDG